MRALAEYLKRFDPADPLERHLTPKLAADGTGMGVAVHSVVRSEVIPDAVWYADAHVKQVRRRIAVDDTILCGQRVDDDGGYVALALYRGWGEAPFGGREREFREEAFS